VFLGIYTNKLDKKARISLPAAFRTQIQSEFVIALSHNQPCLEGCSLERMQKITHQIDRKNIFSQEHQSLALTIFANAEIVCCDQDGRFVLNKDFCKKTHLELDSHIICVGVGATFQIWNSEYFQQAKEAAATNLKNTNPTLFIND